MKTAKQLLSEKTGIPEYRFSDDKGEYITKSIALEAMEEYAGQLRQAAVSGSLPRFSDLMHEDELPKDITDAEYDLWYRRSCVVDGVRMGPPFNKESAFDKANVWKRDYDSRP